MHEEEKNGFLEEVWALGEPVKKKILIVSTAVVMGAVVYVWLGYFNNIIASVPVEAVAANDASSTAVAAVAPGFFERVGGGSAYLLGELGSVAGKIGALFQGPRQYIIKP